MRVAVVGGGFTGLSCAVELVDRGVEVELFEKESTLGGLAGGIKEKNWKWNLEIFYHHIFANDTDIINLAKKVGLPPIFFTPKTSSYINNKVLELDSPVSVLKFSELSFWSRLRMGVGLAVLKIIPNGLFLERYKVTKFLPGLIGSEAYEVIWGKMLKAKFGTKMETVNMAWFWSRVAKRTKKLGYFEGGFENLANKMKDYVEKGGGKVYLNKAFNFDSEEKNKYDKIVVTTPGPLADKLVGKKIMPKIDYLWAQTLILELKESLIGDYWLNILEKDWPFLVTVEQTKMISKKNYGGNTVVYLGNYLEEGSHQLKMERDELLDLYSKYLKKINGEFNKKWIVKSFLFRLPFAQPVFPTNYSKQLNKVPKSFGKYLFANMSMVYPFDRGTNYAVKTGREIAKKCLT